MWSKKNVRNPQRPQRIPGDFTERDNDIGALTGYDRFEMWKVGGEA